MCTIAAKSTEHTHKSDDPVPPDPTPPSQLTFSNVLRSNALHIARTLQADPVLSINFAIMGRA